MTARVYVAAHEKATMRASQRHGYSRGMTILEITEVALYVAFAALVVVALWITWKDRGDRG